MSLTNRLLSATLPLVPRPVVGHFSRRYIAGPDLADAIRTMRALNAQGCMATVDVLGENVRQIEEGQEAAATYVRLLDRIQSDAIDANISVKLTQIGLLLDPARCLEHMRQICGRARELGNFVRIDMEDASVTQATLDTYRTLRAEFERVGVVIQARLRRSRDDIKALAREHANIRLCKGIYLEPRPIAYRDAAIIRRSFIDLLAILLGEGCYTGIATHDEALVYESLVLIDRLGLRPEQYEFQMLLGVDEELRRILLGAGQRLRVYVPYGTHWYAYSLRRLKENPQIAGHVLRNLFR